MDPTTRTITALVDHTPGTRDRYVDFLRALSIVVVVLWHWVFSITQWNSEGALVMPNPIDTVPGLWLATWLLQIMPVFFFVGGFANLAGYEAIERRTRATGTGGGGVRHGAAYLAFVQSRLRRLLAPVAMFVGLWVVADVAIRIASPSTPSVVHWGAVVFVPLWFLGVYVAVVLLAPATIRLHRHAREVAVIGLGAAIVLADLGRFRFGVDRLGWVASALVWVFAHQLGYFWRDGTLTGSGAARRAWALVIGGLTALVVLTNLGVYPRSMVSVRGESSNMFPTTTCIAALAVLQIGVVLLLRPAAERWLARRRVWAFTISVNAVAMTVFTWHMTALAAAIGCYQLAGGSLLTEATGTWWWQRPLWLVLPGIVLAGLLGAFARFEIPARRAEAAGASPVRGS